MQVFCDQLLTPEQCTGLTSAHGSYLSRRGLVSHWLPPGYRLDPTMYDAAESLFNPLGLEHNWFLTALQPKIQLAADLFQFRKLRLVEGARILTYALGGRFNWHRDAHESADKATSYTRRATVSVQLSPPAEYDGGRLELEGHGELPTAQGSVAIFPAYSLHRVTPIERGVRKALVLWGW